MTKRSTVAVTLVVALVLLSGCSAVLDGGNGNGTATDDEGSGDAPEFEYPEGYGADGVSDGQAAVESHNSGLIESGSYSGMYSYDIDAGNDSRVVNVTNRVDFDAEEGYQQVDVETRRSAGSVDIYRTSDTRYRRSEFQNRTSVRSSERPFVAENFTALDPVRPLLTNVSGYDASVEEMNGETVVVYETSGDVSVDQFYGINDSSTISSFSGRFAVDSSGIVRSASYEMTYQVGDEERSLGVKYAISDVGGTSVERPGWVDDA